MRRLQQLVRIDPFKLVAIIVGQENIGRAAGQNNAIPFSIINKASGIFALSPFDLSLRRHCMEAVNQFLC